MKTVVLTIDETIADATLESTLLAIKGVKDIKYENEIDNSTEWKNRLHLPGVPLTEAQMEELAQDMEDETEFISLNEAYTNGLERISAWQSNIK